MLKLEDIHFSYDKISVLEGVNLQVSHGEIVGIMGANGTGKSTLLKLMGGALTPSRGKISFLEESLSALSPKQRAKRIAMVPQESVVPFSFTALEIVLMGRSPYLPPFGFESQRDIRQAHAAMEKTDCMELADRDINTLSGGERQRVVLARALAQCPELLLLDEPTSFLDIRHTAEFIGVLKKLNRSEGITSATKNAGTQIEQKLASDLHRLFGDRAAAGKPYGLSAREVQKMILDAEPKSPLAAFKPFDVTPEQVFYVLEDLTLNNNKGKVSLYSKAGKRLGISPRRVDEMIIDAKPGSLLARYKRVTVSDNVLCSTLKRIKRQHPKLRHSALLKKAAKELGMFEDDVLFQVTLAKWNNPLFAFRPPKLP